LVVVVVDGAVVVVAPFPTVVGLAEAAGGFTANWVPVTTVTWDPLVTWVGSRAMITAPEMEVATNWAAASAAGVAWA
jgi:hypothetical protein